MSDDETERKEHPETHPEPADEAEDLTNEQLEQVAYVMWEHGVSAEMRARVTAELRGQKPPEWAIDHEVNL
jgi:hypothetical protein